MLGGGLPGFSEKRTTKSCEVIAERLAGQKLEIAQSPQLMAQRITSGPSYSAYIDRVRR